MAGIRPETQRRLVYFALLLIVVAAMQPLRKSLEETRARLGFASPPTELRPGEFAATVLLGGFRAVAVDLLWIKALEARRAQDWHALLALTRMISNLQPEFIDGWEFNMWVMTTKLARRAPTDREGWQWLQRGIEFGKEGLRRNPDSWRLAYAVGYQYYYNCGGFDDNRTRQFQQWLLKQTGRTNWQHARDWFARAWELAGPDADPDCLEMLPETHARMALEAEAAGDIAEMSKQRRQAIDILEQLADSYAHDKLFAAEARRKIDGLSGRLHAHELEQQAAELPHGMEKLDLLSRAATEWKAAYRSNPWQAEQIRHLEAIAAEMEQMAHQSTGGLRSRIDDEVFDIWLHLLKGPHRVDEWLMKGDRLADAQTFELKNAIQAGNASRAAGTIEKRSPLRLRLLELEPTPARADAVAALAVACREIAPLADGNQRETIAALERSAWLALLRHGYSDRAATGIETLRRRAETIREHMDTADEALPLKLAEAVEIATALHSLDAHRDYAEKLLREAGNQYIAALARAADDGDLRRAAELADAGRSVWHFIQRHHPDDSQAQHNLNRIGEILTIVILRDSPR